jgi:MoaA/NifB/PqqE/SkfB family radical SAM enzyme
LERSVDLEAYWDRLKEIEIDTSWRNNLSQEYKHYREGFEKAQRREFVADFPMSLEIESSYYCNLKCPFCPRTVSSNEKQDLHMNPECWKRTLAECREHKTYAMQMAHEAESLMNPKIFEMISQAREAGIIEIGLHTNANLLLPKVSEKLIDAGLTKINFSLDAATSDTYSKVRVGGNYEKTINNIHTFLKIKMERNAEYLRTRVSFVEQEDNIDEKGAFYEMWKDTPGLNFIAFQEMIDFGPFEYPDSDWDKPGSEMAAKYAKEKSFHCSHPWEMPIIDVEGNVNPCGAPVRSHTRSFSLGNLLKGDTISSCWNGDKMQQVRSLHNRGEWYKNNMCRVCVKSLRQSHEDLVDVENKLDVNAEK